MPGIAAWGSVLPIFAIGAILAILTGLGSFPGTKASAVPFSAIASSYSILPVSPGCATASIPAPSEEGRAIYRRRRNEDTAPRVAGLWPSGPGDTFCPILSAGIQASPGNGGGHNREVGPHNGPAVSHAQGIGYINGPYGCFQNGPVDDERIGHHEILGCQGLVRGGVCQITRRWGKLMVSDPKGTLGQRASQIYRDPPAIPSKDLKQARHT